MFLLGDRTFKMQLPKMPLGVSFVVLSVLSVGLCVPRSAVCTIISDCLADCCQGSQASSPSTLRYPIMGLASHPIIVFV